MECEYKDIDGICILSWERDDIGYKPEYDGDFFVFKNFVCYGENEKCPSFVEKVNEID